MNNNKNETMNNREEMVMGELVTNDIVKGVSLDYEITNVDMTRARVLAVHGNEIKIRILSHKSFPLAVGETFVVHKADLEKIGVIKEFNREEILDLIANGNSEKLVEYVLCGANLSGADLSGINLRKIDLDDAYLRSANLSGANLSGANLRSADLSGSNLRSADLSNANLYSTNLSGTDLRSAYLSGTDLSYANLRNANLCNTNLSSTNLSGANLRSAYLSGAYLSGANLSGADLRNANLNNVKYDEYTGFYALVCPEEGAFIGYKRVGAHIVKLRITEDALRSSATSRICRCSKAEVLSITTLSGDDDGAKEVFSEHDTNFVYRVGETVEEPDFDTDRWNERSTGIHFFITRQEAVHYI